jgi:hypothetical protein
MNANPLIVGTAALMVAGGLVRLSGTLSHWEGTYTGVVRLGVGESSLSPPQPDSVSVLKDPGGKSDAVLLLNAPDLKGGSCAINFERQWRHMSIVTPQTCVGLQDEYRVHTTMELDGDSLSARLDLVPFGPRGNLDFARKVRLELVGLRSASSRVQLPAVLSAATSDVSSGKGCVPADWTPRALPPLLKPGHDAEAYPPDRLGQRVSWFGVVSNESCLDPSSLAGPGQAVAASINGVDLSILHVDVVSKDGEKAYGGQCTFGLKLANGVGPTVTLASDYVMPFNTITAVERAGAAVWLSLEAHGYAKDFPRGSSYVVAADLCEGRAVWKSDYLTSNGPILLLGDYLVTGYGFTDEPRTLYVLSAHTGEVVQKLALPGSPQGMALMSGLLVVRTNHGVATFVVWGS